jgi:hypothetical protein
MMEQERLESRQVTGAGPRFARRIWFGFPAL